MTIRLEICVDDEKGLSAAIAGGADRIELCSALALGGLTPSPGLMRAAAAAPLPVYAMIRPHAGPFRFDAGTEALMMGDIDAARAAGLAGVVLGANADDGRLDLALLSRLAHHAEGMGLTLHRAFDLVPDPLEALEAAISLGFERILTSGLRPKAMDGLPQLRTLVERAADRIAIMPGSGVRPENVADILRATGATEIHSSCSAPAKLDARAVAFGFQSQNATVTNLSTVRAMRAALDALAA